MSTKICPDCKEEKSLEKFPSHTPWYCQDCINRRARTWRQRKRREFLAANPPIVRTHKQCKMCRETKPVSEFNFNNKEKNWFQPYCKPCSLQRSHADKVRRGWDEGILRYRCTRMGTTPEWYGTQFSSQSGVCAICFQPETHPVKKGGKLRNLAIDHNHSTGKVRGLLCCKCNQSLHRLEKFSGWAESAVSYLEKYKETET